MKACSKRCGVALCAVMMAWRALRQGATISRERQSEPSLSLALLFSIVALLLLWLDVPDSSRGKALFFVSPICTWKRGNSHKSETKARASTTASVAAIRNFEIDLYRCITIAHCCIHLSWHD
jgi:hypothetical protein